MSVCLRCSPTTKFVFDVSRVLNCLHRTCVFFIRRIEWTLCGREEWLLYLAHLGGGK